MKKDSVAIGEITFTKNELKIIPQVQLRLANIYFARKRGIKKILHDFEVLESQLIYDSDLTTTEVIQRNEQILMPLCQYWNDLPSMGFLSHVDANNIDQTIEQINKFNRFIDDWNGRDLAPYLTDTDVLTTCHSYNLDFNVFKDFQSLNPGLRSRFLEI